MLRSIKNLIGYPIHATDGDIGSVKDCLYDDRHWRLRYLVADTGKWLPKKKVLISPMNLEEPSTGWYGKHFPVSLSKAKIESCPELDEDAPVSRQYERELAGFYQHEVYWDGPYAWGATPAPIYAPHSAIKEDDDNATEEHVAKMRRIEQCHLRSARETLGYSVLAKGDSFGHIEDFIMDTQTWKLQYLVVHYRKWLKGKKSLIDIDWTESFDWKEREAHLSLAPKQIEIAPEYDPRTPINQGYLDRLYDYYGKPKPQEELAAPIR